MGFPTGYLDLTHAYNVLHSSYQQGKLQGGDTERQKQIFLVTVILKSGPTLISPKVKLIDGDFRRTR